MTLNLEPHDIEELRPWYTDSQWAIGVGDYKVSNYLRIPSEDGAEVHAGTWMRGGSHEPGVEFVAVSDPLPLLPVLAAVALAACVLNNARDSRERREFVHDCQARGGRPVVHVDSTLGFKASPLHVGCSSTWRFECLRDAD
ncbi:MAG TPA: hypothetical protein VLB81_12505 [Gaiellales bacterium]|nr:hypothetical protein [Gaiellales bacterium]